MIPKEVTEIAQEQIRLGGTPTFIGRYDGRDVYMCEFEEDMTIGLPVVYLWDGRKAELLSGDRAGFIISALIS